ncbi:MAG: terminase family protein [Gemmatimonadota bacterium]|nr:terminase family protein [Gemmatimonadota bacterium]
MAPGTYRGEALIDHDLEAFEYWCSHFYLIQHPKGRRYFELRPAQRETVRAFLAEDKVLILKARQIGFTTVVMAFCLWSAIFRPDFRVIILNRREKDAVKNLNMAMYAWEHMDKRFRSLLAQRTNANQLEAKFDNGSSIVSYPSNNNPARGDTASLMILDEWAFMPNPDEAWASVEPVTDIGGRIVALSTANGWGNMFHQTWVNSERGENDFYRLFYPWSAVPDRDEAWYAQKARSTPEWMLHQEYPSDPDTAFIKSGNAVFPLDSISQYKRRKPELYELDGPEDHLRRFEVRQVTDGYLGVYEPPVIGKVYVIGADTSAGLEHGDYSSAHVIRADANPAVVAHWHGLVDPDLYGRHLCRLGYWYNKALLAPEANNTGIAVINAIKRANYPRVYRRRSLDRMVDRSQDQLGFWTSKATKPLIISDLGQMLREGSLALEDGPTLAELRTYVRDAQGATHGSPHDDRVVSLAIAVHMLQFAHVSFTPQETGPPPGSFDWFAEQMDETSAAPMVIGQHNQRAGHA